MQNNQWTSNNTAPPVFYLGVPSWQSVNPINHSSDSFIFIGGGYCNTAASTSAVIGGGTYNCNIGGLTVIGGGTCNTIGNIAGSFDSQFSFIGGGYCNCVDSAAFTSNFGFIGNGQCNYVGPGTNYGTIVNGLCNTVTGNCSAILGGSGNSDGGLAWAGVFGCNVTAVSACAFHANNFVAPNMPASLPSTPRTFYIVVSGGVCYVAIS